LFEVSTTLRDGGRSKGAVGPDRVVEIKGVIKAPSGKVVRTVNLRHAEAVAPKLSAVAGETQVATEGARPESEIVAHIDDLAKQKAMRLFLEKLEKELPGARW